jgi:hypothetical protein
MPDRGSGAARLPIEASGGGSQLPASVNGATAANAQLLPETSAR